MRISLRSPRSGSKKVGGIGWTKLYPNAQLLKVFGIQRIGGRGISRLYPWAI
jgi:hypothetical protein